MASDTQKAAPGSGPTPDWKKLEELVVAIQQDLAPGATVSHNVMLLGHDSGTNRQIDVLVEQSVGQYQMRIVIDCKDYGRPVDVKGVEGFIGMVKDVGAHQGSMVCPKGFTPSAKKRAKRDHIALYSPVDTDPHKWTMKVALPALCEFREAAIGFAVSCSAPTPFTLQRDFLTALEAFDSNGNSLGTLLKSALERWSEGLYPTEAGEHSDVPLFDSALVYVDNGHGTRVPITLTVNLKVKAERYFGQLPLKKIRGLRDEHTGLVYSNGFTMGNIDANQVISQWRALKADEEEPTIAIRFDGLIGHNAEDDPRAKQGYNPFNW
jgi:hypothetical protein